MVKKIAIFGSTGSIGQNTIALIRENKQDFKIAVLTAHSNVELLASQALEFNPFKVVIGDKTKYQQLKLMLQSTNIIVEAGEQSINDAASEKFDLVVMAIVGAAALKPTITAITAKNNIALANKECLVCAGSLIMKLAKENQVCIIPVDSEHSGLFQIFDAKKQNLIKDITLSASGGPFREYSHKQLENVSLAQALKHPTWEMGAKISIDSATLVNKCLEVIEAIHLFALPPEKIKILIHPESIIHAMVNFIDGSNLAQFSVANMQIPISYALYYPNRINLDRYNNFSLSDIQKISFFEPDSNKFHSLKLLESTLKTLDLSSSLIFNIANDEAVSYFLQKKINFLQITQTIEEMLNNIAAKKLANIEVIYAEIEFIKNKTKLYMDSII
jgi:1-deoxy-D-xylulose-5-phosphate reductoisomerase